MGVRERWCWSGGLYRINWNRKRNGVIKVRRLGLSQRGSTGNKTCRKGMGNSAEGKLTLFDAWTQRLRKTQRGPGDLQSSNWELRLVLTLNGNGTDLEIIHMEIIFDVGYRVDGVSQGGSGERSVTESWWTSPLGAWRRPEAGENVHVVGGDSNTKWGRKTENPGSQRRERH